MVLRKKTSDRTKSHNGVAIISAMLANIKPSGLDRTDAKRLHFEPLAPHQTKQLTGLNISAFKIPYFNADGTLKEFFRLRYLPTGNEFGSVELSRYWQPPNTLPEVYLPNYIAWDEYEGTKILTEGEKKAAGACKNNLPTMGLGGIYSYGSKKRGIELLPSIADRFQRGEECHLAWDSDTVGDRHKEMSKYRLATQLHKLGVAVFDCTVPQLKGRETKLDEFLDLVGPDGWIKHVAKNKKLITPKDAFAYIKFPNTDLGNAESLAFLHGDNLRHIEETGHWYKWRGHYWSKASGSELLTIAKDTVRIRQKAALELSEDTRKKALAFAIDSENRKRLTAMTALGADTAPMASAIAQWDKDPMLFACANGVIDLRTGKLEPGMQSSLISKYSPVAYNPDARAPRWEQFLKEIFVDAALIQYMQSAVGYTLTGLITEHCFFACYGGGSNGKSTFLEAIRYVIGDSTYARTTPFATFLQNDKTGSAASPALVKLKGARFITASESPEGRSKALDAPLIKNFTGGDKVPARPLYGDVFEYDPVGKIWLLMNHKPRIKDDSDGFWRRIRLIPFTQKFTGKTKDKHLKELFKSEAPGILAWAVRGCLNWQKKGLIPPTPIAEATEEYRKDEDPLTDFLNECCVMTSPDIRTKLTELYAAYMIWATNGGRYYVRKQNFNERMRNKFKSINPKNIETLCGVGLKPKISNNGQKTTKGRKAQNLTQTQRSGRRKYGK